MLTQKDYDGWGAGSNEKSGGWGKATPLRGATPYNPVSHW